MRGLIGIVGLLAVTVAACDRPVPVALNAPPPPPTPYAAPSQYPTPAQYPPPPAPQYGAQYPPPAAAAQYSPPKMQAPGPQSQSDVVAEPASNATCFTGPGLPLCVPADQIWYKSATEWYNPSTYCKWGREQLPVRLQKVCSELDQKYPPRKANWKRLEADNGAAFAVDLNSIAHGNNGMAEMQVCIVDNNACAIMPGTWNPTIYRFDCHGHYMDVYGGGGLQMAPPRSVVGQMAALACAGAKDTRFADDSETAKTAPRPSPTDYCVNFSPDACERIKQVVEAYKPSEPPPSYCKPGFALVGSGLTPEQLRICYVITGFRRQTQDARPPTLVTASATPSSENVIGQWSGKGNAKSNDFHVGPGPWSFRVKSSESISGGIYRVSDKTGVYNFGYTDGDQTTQLTASGDVYFVVKSAGSWTVTITRP